MINNGGLDTICMTALLSFQLESSVTLQFDGRSAAQAPVVNVKKLLIWRSLTGPVETEALIY